MNNENALAIRSTQELAAIGKLFEESGMFGCSQQGQGTVLAMSCVMMGKSPLEINQTYHIIDGKLSMRADAMLAKFLERGGRFRIEERSKDRAAATFFKDENELQADYTMADAREAGICFQRGGKTLKTNWRQHPKAMLWARLVSDSVRALDPGVNMGTYSPEEIQDFDDGDRVTRATPAAPIETKPRAKAAPKAEKKAEPDQAKPAPKPEPEAKPEPEVEGEVVDPSVMPIGKYAGTPWTKFTEPQLKQVLAVTNRPEITDAHKAAVQVELDSREGGAA